MLPLFLLFLLPVTRMLKIMPALFMDHCVAHVKGQWQLVIPILVQYLLQARDYKQPPIDLYHLG